MSREIQPVTHCIFDVDGLLVDSERVWTQMMERLLEPYGKQFNWDIKLKLMGKKETEAGKILIEMLDLPLTVDQYISRIQELQAEMMPGAPLLPGIDKLISHLSKHKVPIAVATGNSEYEFSLKEKGHSKFFQQFHHKVLSGSDPEVIHGKPAPDCFLVCARRFPDNPDPLKCGVDQTAHTPDCFEGQFGHYVRAVDPEASAF